METLVYPELSYKIVGLLFDVYKHIGAGMSERIYQRAVALALKGADLKFEEQLFAPLMYKGQKVTNNYFDFLIEDQVVLELKRGQQGTTAHIEQVKQYLVSKRLKLGILAYFGANAVNFKRVVNLV